MAIELVLDKERLSGWGELECSDIQILPYRIFKNVGGESTQIGTIMAWLFDGLGALENAWPLWAQGDMLEQDSYDVARSLYGEEYDFLNVGIVSLLHIHTCVINRPHRGHDHGLQAARLLIETHAESADCVSGKPHPIDEGDAELDPVAFDRARAKLDAYWAKLGLDSTHVDDQGAVFRWAYARRILSAG